MEEPGASGIKVLVRFASMLNLQMERCSFSRLLAEPMHPLFPAHSATSARATCDARRRRLIAGILAVEKGKCHWDIAQNVPPDRQTPSAKRHTARAKHNEKSQNH
jgi:hypothetical protein